MEMIRTSKRVADIVGALTAASLWLTGKAKILTKEVKQPLGDAS